MIEAIPVKHEPEYDCLTKYDVIGLLNGVTGNDITKFERVMNLDADTVYLQLAFMREKRHADDLINDRRVREAKIKRTK